MFCSLQQVQAKGIEPEGSMTLDVLYNEVIASMKIGNQSIAFIGQLDLKSFDQRATNSFETSKAIYNAFGIMAKGTATFADGSRQSAELYCHSDTSQIYKYTHYNFILSSVGLVVAGASTSKFRFQGDLTLANVVDPLTGQLVSIYKILATKSAGMDCYQPNSTIEPLCVATKAEVDQLFYDKQIEAIGVMKTLIDSRLTLKRELAAQPTITPQIQKCIDELPSLKTAVQVLDQQIAQLQQQQESIVKDISSEQIGVVQVQAQLASQQQELQSLRTSLASSQQQFNTFVAQVQQLKDSILTLVNQRDQRQRDITKFTADTANVQLLIEQTQKLIETLPSKDQLPQVIAKLRADLQESGVTVHKLTARRDELRLYLNNNPSKAESSTKAKAELAAIDLKLTEQQKALLTTQKQVIEQMLYQKSGTSGDYLIALLFIILVVLVILIIRQRKRNSAPVQQPAPLNP